MLSDIASAKRLYSAYVSRRGEVEDRVGRRLWSSTEISSRDAVNRKIGEILEKSSPFVAGKIGANEQNLLMWGAKTRIPLGLLGLYRLVSFKQTTNCAKNAGIVPRSEQSYEQFFSVLESAVQDVDVLGIWFYPGEYLYLESRGYLAKELCYFFDLEPFFSDVPWTRHLAGKRVLLVSPFSKSAERQHSRLSDVWPNGMMPKFDLLTYKFPYLFSKVADQGVGWQEVHADFERFVGEVDFDVALIGCGGLSLPLASICRRADRQAIHLGGATQLLFGIRASRYEADPKYKRMMNEFWVRPEKDEVPPEASSIENGCYW